MSQIRWRKTGIMPGYLKIIICAFGLLQAASALATDVQNLTFGEKILLSATEGDYSGTVGLHPIDGSLHVAWVNDGRIFYQVRTFDGSLSAVDTLSLTGLSVFGSEEGTHLRKCVDFDFDEKGRIHMVFGEISGDVYYLSGSFKHWGAPERIVNKHEFTIFPYIIVQNGIRHVVYEDSEIDYMYYVRYDGTWHDPVYVEQGEFPQLARGSEGRIYFYSRGARHVQRNVRYGVMFPDASEWYIRNDVTNADGRLGSAPGMAIQNGQMYLVWPNGVPDAEKTWDKTSAVYCATSPEPGFDWSPRINKGQPLMYESTGDPHPRAAFYSEGTLLCLNGRRLYERIITHKDRVWSETRPAPWEDDDWYGGIVPEVVSDGRTVWVLSTIGEIALYPIVNPEAAITNPPAPAMTVTPSDDDPLEQSFSASFAGPVEGYLWDFGDGSTSTESEPVHRYAAFGVYTVTLTVTAEWGASSQSLDVTVNIAAPAANFGAESTTGTAPLTVQFADSSTGEVTAWAWDFGDGSTGSVQHAQHVYTVPGVYPVTLRVEGAGGADSLTRENYISVLHAAPSAAFIADTTQGTGTLTVQFTDQSTGEVTAWAWDFGDGSSSEAQHPSHTYAAADTYSVALTVTGPGGTAIEEKADFIKVAAVNSGVDGDAAQPRAFALGQNYPNPFNGGTAFDVKLPQAAEIHVNVYDAKGRRVRTLASGLHAAGVFTLHWDGCDHSGSDLASGLYIIKLQAGDKVSQRKVMYLK